MIRKKEFLSLVARVVKLEEILAKRYISDSAMEERQRQIIREYLLGKENEDENGKDN